MSMGKWKTPTKIKVKQISGKIFIPTEYVHVQCSNCYHCFLMLEHKGEYNFKFCPNCASEMRGIE